MDYRRRVSIQSMSPGELEVKNIGTQEVFTVLIPTKKNEEGIYEITTPVLKKDECKTKLQDKDITTLNKIMADAMVRLENKAN